MAVEFRESETKDNLMRAFAGESQARNRYTFAASQAKKNGLHVVSAIFAFTASQEKEHAEIFYNHLKEMAGETIFVDGGYPVDITEDVEKLLRMAQHNEYEEHEPIDKTFGEKALEEGKLFVSDVEVEWMCLNCGYVYKGLEAPKVCPVCKHDRGYFIRFEFAPFGK